MVLTATMSWWENKLEEVRRPERTGGLANEEKKGIPLCGLQCEEKHLQDDVLFDGVVIKQVLCDSLEGVGAMMWTAEI